METIFHIPVPETVPKIGQILKAQGVPESPPPPPRMLSLAEEGLAAYRRLAQPVGVVRPVSEDEFAGVFAGDGKNEPGAPLGQMFRQASQLVLFAVTIGEHPSAEIARLFDENLFAEGAMLDATASEGTELAAATLERLVGEFLRHDGGLTADAGVQRFSPGYCGWHVSAQRKLFSLLEPDRIGIGLTTSCLMHPLKSISGVILVGPKSIFDFADDLPFCETCRTHECRERLRGLMNQTL